MVIYRILEYNCRGEAFNMVKIRYGNKSSAPIVIVNVTDNLPAHNKPVDSSSP